MHEPREERAEREGGDEIPAQIIDDAGRGAGVAERPGRLADQPERQQDQRDADQDASGLTDGARAAFEKKRRAGP